MKVEMYQKFEYESLFVINDTFYYEKEKVNIEHENGDFLDDTWNMVRIYYLVRIEK